MHLNQESKVIVNQLGCVCGGLLRAAKKFTVYHESRSFPLPQDRSSEDFLKTEDFPRLKISWRLHAFWVYGVNLPSPPSVWWIFMKPDRLHSSREFYQRKAWGRDWAEQRATKKRGTWWILQTTGKLRDRRRLLKLSNDNTRTYITRQVLHRANNCEGTKVLSLELEWIGSP